MIIYISCAKTMNNRAETQTPFTTLPVFGTEANDHAAFMAQFSAEELKTKLRVNTKLAAENYLRYHDFFSENNRPIPALNAYTGIVFKHIRPELFDNNDWTYAQSHLLIASFLYGLLRPLDGIKPYRMEGDIRLPERDAVTMFDYWKPILTDFFIKQIKEDDGILVNLASSEMKNLLNWEKVEKEVRVITPEFLVNKGNKPRNIVIYTKICRGEMVRYILKNHIAQPEELQGFNWEGFTYNAEESHNGRLVFTL